MDIKKRTLTATEESVLTHVLLDVQDWVDKAIDGKVNNCKKKMLSEWTPKLLADESVGSIPADEDALIALIVKRDDYEGRTAKNKPPPE